MSGPSQADPPGEDIYNLEQQDEGNDDRDRPSQAIATESTRSRFSSVSAKFQAFSTDS